MNHKMVGLASHDYIVLQWHKVKGHAYPYITRSWFYNSKVMLIQVILLDITWSADRNTNVFPVNRVVLTGSKRNETEAELIWDSASGGRYLYSRSMYSTQLEKVFHIIDCLRVSPRVPTCESVSPVREIWNGNDFIKNIYVFFIFEIWFF